MGLFGFNSIKKKKIKELFRDCKYYVFEICSLKLYVKDGYQVQHELTNDHKFVLQSETDLYDDLKIIRDLIPKHGIVIFQTHFRPSFIYDDASRAIDKRKIIYNVVNKFCNANENTYLFDPSILLKADKSLFDGDTHFNQRVTNHVSIIYIIIICKNQCSNNNEIRNALIYMIIFV